MGTKRKFWCHADDRRRYLFKYARAGTGEDWAEKIAAEVACALGVPHAEVDLAVYDGQPGTLTLAITDDEHALAHGNELLQERRPEYPVHAAYSASEHTVTFVLDALSQGFIRAPEGVASADLVTAVDWFLGYLMLDALIGNTDRHHENWAVLVRIGQAERYAALAPSYDHASSLGRELKDHERCARLEGRDRRRTVEAYCKKARSALYRSVEARAPMSPLDAFSEAVRHAQLAGKRWLERLGATEHATMSSIVDRIPAQRMSEPARQFALAVMATNRRALLSLLEVHP
ncbi:HipA domain-containing protein [Sorangium sp. So ce291]|uniref:HipA domain-containing protein n=1 Tax=Sorangium sp. So ce291 TaxID=3133294 RepID=UPI003F5E942E